MRRLRAAALLLAGVLLFSLGSSAFVSRAAAELTAPLTRAEQLVQAAEPADAAPYLKQAEQRYQRLEIMLSALLSERELDNVRLGFAAAEAALQLGDTVQAGAALSELRQAVRELRRTGAISLDGFL